MPGKHDIREIHVVCNTHWDREFRETFEITRRALLDMMDITLDLLATDRRYASYTLDAHAILVEDYLEMRPERRAQVEQMLAERRLFIGPWYTLPDAMNTGGEALVRNLIRARAVADSLGGRCMRAGYTPNNWGQPSQMPQLFRGFGIDSALIYRGISPHECPSEFIWEGADGSEVLGHRFARLARYNWYYLVYRPATRGVEPTEKQTLLAGSTEKPFRIADNRSRATPNFRLLDPAVRCDDGRAAEAVRAMLDLEGPDSSTGLFLSMHGHDMSVAHPLDADVVKAAVDALPPGCTVKMSNLEDFIESVRVGLDAETATRLTGERRMNLKEGFWTYLLPGTISARTYLKVLNTEAEDALTGEAEPLACLATALGGEYPARYLERAWGFLLSNHTHDANAGCAPDRVCADMEYRYRQCLDIADICSQDAMKHIARNLDGGAGPAGEIKLVVFNPLPRTRSEVVEFELAIPETSAARSVRLVDETGQECEIDVVGSRDDSLFVDNHWDVPTYTEVTTFKARALLNNLPPLGYATFGVQPREDEPEPGETLARADFVMENEHLQASIRPDGTVDLLHHATGRTYYGLNHYRDQGEAGNAWTHQSPAEDEVIETRGETAKLEWTERTPLSATVRATVTMLVPAEGVDGKHRSPERVALTLDTYYTVLKGDPRLLVRVEFDNRARDHWLRAVFPTDVETTVVHADTHFDVVERTIKHPDDQGWIEPFSGTAPMHSMVDLSDSGGGLALLTAGLLEYEVFDDARRSLVLSLVRSFPIKLQVSEEKMEVLPDTGVQCPGPQCFRYALLPHAGDYVACEALLWARRLNNPPRAVQIAPAGGHLPPRFSLIRVEGRGLVVTAVKKAERSNELLIRLFNSSAETQEGTVSFGCDVASLTVAKLDESPNETLPVADNSISLSVPPKKILTLLAELKEG